MAAHVLRLRIALLFGALRGDRAHVVRMILGLLALLFGTFRGHAGHVARVVTGLVILAAATVAACWALLTLQDASTEEALAVTVLGGSAVTLGFALAPPCGGKPGQVIVVRFSADGTERKLMAEYAPVRKVGA